MAEFMDAEPKKDIAVPTDTDQIKTEPTPGDSNWYGEDYTELVKAKGWGDVDSALKSYTELEKFKGKGEHLVIPETDDAEGWSTLFNKIGRPESADKYEFANETGVEISDDLMSSFKAFAHKEGYSQKQLAGAIQFQLEAVKASEEIFAQQRKERTEEHVEAMRTKWRDEYDTTVTKIDAIAEKLQVKDFLEEMGISKEPEIVNMLLTIANSDSEGSLSPNSEQVVKKTSLDRMEEIKKSEAFTSKFHPKHKEIMAEFMALNMELANSGQGKAPQ